MLLGCDLPIQLLLLKSLLSAYDDDRLVDYFMNYKIVAFYA